MERSWRGLEGKVEGLFVYGLPRRVGSGGFGRANRSDLDFGDSGT